MSRCKGFGDWPCLGRMIPRQEAKPEAARAIISPPYGGVKDKFSVKRMLGGQRQKSKNWPKLPDEAEGRKEKKMRNFFIPGISREEGEKLQRLGVDFCNFEVDGAHGVVVEEEFFPRALEVLGAAVEAETATSFDGIVAVSLRLTTAPAPDGPAVTVKVENWNGRNQDGFVRLVKEILVPVIGRNVFLSVPHQQPTSPVCDDQFHIFIWSSPTGSVRTCPPSRIWGIDVDCRDKGFSPSGQGVAIVDTETGWSVAVLVGNNLFIHHDLCEKGTDRELKIFRRLLEEVAAELSLSPAEKSERQRRLAEERRQRSREAYIRECSARFERTLTGTRETITRGQTDVVRLQQELTKRIRETAGAERKLEQLNTRKCGELEKYGREFDKLLAVAKVRDIQVADGVVKVFTDTLYCSDPRTGIVHDIGQFRIEIYRDCQNGGVRWFNLTRQVRAYKEGMHAPHVFPEGKACYGNTAEIWPELIGNYEFAAAAQVAIQFVESVNTDDDAGCHIDKWPVAPAEMQPERVKEEIRRKEEGRKNNPFVRISSDHPFVIMGRQAEASTSITNCGECWCWGGDRGKISTNELAQILGVAASQVRQTLANYFAV